MTNAQIIFEERIKAMESGIIGNTGRLITVEIDGEKKQILEPEEMHTFFGWKSLGFSIKKGEKTKVVTYLWKMKKLNKAEKAAVEALGADPENDDDHFIKVKANLFSASQVHRPDKTPNGSEHKTESDHKTVTENSVPDPAPMPGAVVAAVDELHIVFENGSMIVDMREFFPANHKQLDSLVKIIKEDHEHETDLINSMISHMQNRVQDLGGTETKGDYKTEKLKAAYRKNLSWLGAVPVEEKPVKVSSKSEMFEILSRSSNGDMVRKVKIGYRATYAGYTFFITKKDSWDIYESRSGLCCGYASTKSGCADYLAKRLDLHKMEELNFDDLEARKLSTPLETIAS